MGDAGDAGERWRGAAGHEARAAVVLRCVLARLPPRELWRCGAVCRAWRRAAADGALWRRALRPHAAPRALRALARAVAATGAQWSWRAEWARAAARWRPGAALAARAAGGAALRCAALSARGDRVALVDEDAMLTIFEQTLGGDASAWRMRCGGALSGEWREAEHALWAPGGRALLLAARLALAERHEILVVGFDERWRRRVLCRCAGAVASWLHDGAFLSLQLHALAPARACTTVWLNAASQETQSEPRGAGDAAAARLQRGRRALDTHHRGNRAQRFATCARLRHHNDEDEDEDEDDASAGDDTEPSAGYYRALHPP
ncbi:uncharacterized protein LOC112046548, partial [Bicyclus anynana]|uniref:Uncharacterized protein LOC112046548 n=1 Tax=Bicyclus anynana TaxID=110368 RepID=A0ABM3M6M1_BICAN